MQTQLIEKEIVQETAVESNGALEVGRLLKAERKKRNLTLEDVCETLKIRKFFLESIEAGRFDQLPGSVYTIGFVKVYCRFLDVNFEEISSSLIELTEISQIETPLTTYRLPPPRNLLTRWSIVLSILLVVVSLSYFYFTHETTTTETPLGTTKNEIKKEVPAPVIKQEETTITSNESQSQTQTDTQLVDESSLVTIITTKETWIKVTDGANQLVVARLLRPGTYYRIESRPGLLLTAGEADALQIYLGNTKLSRPIPQNAGLLESFPLDVENLKTYTGTPSSEEVPNQTSNLP